MKIFQILIFVLVSTQIHAREYCERPEKIDPELPAGLSGTYEIIGRLPNSDITYAGRVEIKEDETAYTLKRTVGGVTTIGDAWIEFCSPDKYMVLNFKYSKTPKPILGSCFLRTNGNNYYIISCYTRFIGTELKQRGLESMFQLQEP